MVTALICIYSDKPSIEKGDGLNYFCIDSEESPSLDRHFIRKSLQYSRTARFTQKHPNIRKRNLAMLNAPRFI